MSDEEHIVVEPWLPPAWTRMGRTLDAGDPLQTPYAWITEEVSSILSSISLGDTRKRRTTILMMADAVASGTREVQAVLEDDRTLGHAGWYQRIRKDPDFENTYKAVLERAQLWYDQLDARRVQKRTAQVEQTRDELVALTEEAVRVMHRLLTDDNVSSTVRRGIITDILDRASEDTALKASATVGIRPQGEPSMRDIRGRRPKAIEDNGSGVGVEVGGQLPIPEPTDEDPVTVEVEDGPAGS